MDDTSIATDPLVSCDMQGGTLAVHDDRVVIDRSSASMFEDKTIPLAEVDDVGYSAGILTGHIQVRQTGVDADDAGLFGHPVDENTLYFGRSGRDCARRLRDAILERAGATDL